MLTVSKRVKTTSARRRSQKENNLTKEKIAKVSITVVRAKPERTKDETETVEVTFEPALEQLAQEAVECYAGKLDNANRVRFNSREERV